MDFFSIVCGAASLLWLAAGALALDRLLEEVFCDEQDD